MFTGIVLLLTWMLRWCTFLNLPVRKVNYSRVRCSDDTLQVLLYGFFRSEMNSLFYPAALLCIVSPDDCLFNLSARLLLHLTSHLHLYFAHFNQSIKPVPGQTPTTNTKDAAIAPHSLLLNKAVKKLAFPVISRSCLDVHFSIINS